MIVLQMWVCICALIALLLWGVACIVACIDAADDASSDSNFKEKACYRKLFLHRFVRGVVALSAGVAALITWGNSQWEIGWDLLLVCGLSIVATILAARFGPKAPDGSSIYTKSEFDNNICRLQRNEIRTLLKRLGDLQAKSTSDDSYREVHAMDELETYLNERLLNL